MKTKLTVFLTSLVTTAFLVGCGAEDKVNEVANAIEIKGHWLMTESENSSDVQKAIENESMVLSFKDGKAAFSPVDSAKGRALYALLPGCVVGPRPYDMDDRDVVFEAVAGCEERRTTITVLNNDSLKFPDLENKDITRTFVRITEEKYQALVRPEDRKL